MSVETVFQHVGTHTGMADAGLATALALNAATGDKSTWTAFMPMAVERVGLLITTAITYAVPTALAVVAFDRRVTYGSDTGRVEMGRITIPDAAIAGAVYYLDIPNANENDPGDLAAGGQVVCEVVTAGAGGGGIAGAFQPFVCWQPRGEAPLNNRNGANVQTLFADTTTVQV